MQRALSKREVLHQHSFVLHATNCKLREAVGLVSDSSGASGSVQFAGTDLISPVPG